MLQRIFVKETSKKKMVVSQNFSSHKRFLHPSMPESEEIWKRVKQLAS